ncbi:hypothetical protein [Serratia sp. 2723]|uniref:hypothetical protein n=1 Tax=unclassified Serratia (in: enterobacteria) TaxID=2647522 RepID=UPI003D1D3EFD
MNIKPSAPPGATSVQWLLWIVAFGFLMQTLDTTIVNTTLTKEPGTGSTRTQ